MDPLSIVFPRIHSEGFRFIAIFGVVALILFFVWEPLGWLGLLATIWCLYFFRDPDRYTPIGEGLVIAPADGIVCATGLAVPPPELDLPTEEMMRVGIFMNIFNCHVNRMPVDGTVVKSVYHPGKFLNASFDKASEENERQALAVQTADGQRIGVVQIAGLIARRIVCQVREGDQVKRYLLFSFMSTMSFCAMADSTESAFLWICSLCIWVCACLPMYLIIMRPSLMRTCLPVRSVITP